MANARQTADRPRQTPFVHAPLTDADREGSGQFAIRRDDIVGEPEADQMPPLLTGLLALFAAIAAAGTALAALRVHAGAGVSLLDLVSVACLLLSSIALLVRRRLGQVLLELSSPMNADPQVAESRADSSARPHLVARPKVDARHTPSLQAVTLNDDSEACFEPALSQCTKAERDAFITTLRDLSSVSEVHVARVRLVESGRVAERVLVVTVGSSIEAAEAHTALSLALEGVTGRVLPVWFLRHDSIRLAQLRAAGCLVLRRRALKRWPYRRS